MHRLGRQEGLLIEIGVARWTNKLAVNGISGGIQLKANSCAKIGRRFRRGQTEPGNAESNGQCSHGAFLDFGFTIVLNDFRNVSPVSSASNSSQRPGISLSAKAWHSPWAAWLSVSS
jgi:hypothetical protein